MGRIRSGKRIYAYLVLSILVVSPAFYAPSAACASGLGDVESILGVKGQVQEGATIFRFPRSDIKVTIDGEPVSTAFGFGAWTAWKAMGDDAIVMGDLVLLEDEVNPVISALAEANINVTALHNHFLGETPRIMFMHIGGMGNPAVLAQGLRNALAKTATPKPQQPAVPQQPPALTLDTKRIEEIISHRGDAGGGIFKITVGRSGATMRGVEITSSMGLNSWAAFLGTNERAHVAGDVAMNAKEVNPVIRALRRGSINVVAVHNHMIDEEPRIFFLHYWGTGPAEKLAQAVRRGVRSGKGAGPMSRDGRSVGLSPGACEARAQRTKRRDAAKQLLHGLAVLIPFLLLCPGTTWCQEKASVLRLVRTIPLPRVTGRIDHIAIDLAKQRLFVAALGNNTVEVIDLQAGQRTRSIGGLAEPQGLLYLAETNRLFVTSGGDGSLKMLDGQTFALMGTVKFPGRCR